MGCVFRGEKVMGCSCLFYHVNFVWSISKRLLCVEILLLFSHFVDPVCPECHTILYNTFCGGVEDPRVDMRV